MIVDDLWFMIYDCKFVRLEVTRCRDFDNSLYRYFGITGCRDILRYYEEAKGETGGSREFEILRKDTIAGKSAFSFISVYFGLLPVFCMQRYDAEEGRVGE